MTPSPLRIPTGKKFDIAGFGTNAVDHLITVAEYPAFNSKVELLNHRMLAGGEVASTMVGLRRLGFTTAYAGRFGDDAEGRLGQNSLADEGVDISFAQTIPGARTQIAYIVIDAGTGERTVMWHRDQALSYVADEAPSSLAGECRILHMTPHDTAACTLMASKARSAGAIVSLDVDKHFDGLESLLPLVDVCIVSSEFAEGFFGPIGTDAALEQIAAEFGCPIVGCTLGADGSHFFVNGTHRVSPGFPVPGTCIDTTGAGDAFRAGFLYGLLTGFSIEDACTSANKVASLKCRALGARTGLPTLAELISL